MVEWIEIAIDYKAVHSLVHPCSRRSDISDKRVLFTMVSKQEDTTTTNRRGSVLSHEEISSFADEILGKIETQSSKRSVLSKSNQSTDGAAVNNVSTEDNDAPTNCNNKQLRALSTLTNDSIDVDELDDSQMNVAYDFSAWDSFRASLSSERQQVLKKSYANSRKLSFNNPGSGGGTMSSFSEADEEESEDEEEFFNRMPSLGEDEEVVNDDGPEIISSVKSKKNNQQNNNTSEWFADVMTSLELTQEERYDNAAWRMRLEVDQVFSKNYTPQAWEQKEMDAIINFLGLKDPELHTDYLVRVFGIYVLFCFIGVYCWMCVCLMCGYCLVSTNYMHIKYAHIICTPLI